MCEKVSRENLLMQYTHTLLSLTAAGADVSSKLEEVVYELHEVVMSNYNEKLAILNEAVKEYWDKVDNEPLSALEASANLIAAATNFVGE